MRANEKLGELLSTGSLASTVYGPAEQRILTGEFLSDHVNEFLASKDFLHGLSDLQTEGDAYGAELEQADRMDIEDVLETVRATAELDRFVCETNVCIGSIRASDTQRKSASLLQMRAPSRLPTPTLSIRPI